MLLQERATMATRKQKQELVDALKFTPVTVRILIQGYGGESYAGRVDRKIYDYFVRQKIDLDEYAGDWDGQFSDHVPQDMQPFSPGSPYDCDDLWHASGAELSDLNTITVETIEDSKTIWEHNLGYSDLEEAGVTVEQSGGCELDDLDPDQIVYWGGQGEKGCFFDGELVLKQPFDPKKLRINFENCDNWYIVTSVEYDGEEIDGSGGYSTTGKWSENKWMLPDGEETYESVCLDDREDEGLSWDEEWDPAAELNKITPPYTVTDWFDRDINPVHRGEYEVMIDAPWPDGGPGMAEWTGRTWKQNGKKVTIHQWRGITENLS